MATDIRVPGNAVCTMWSLSLLKSRQQDYFLVLLPQHSIVPLSEGNSASLLAVTYARGWLMGPMPHLQFGSGD